MGKPNLRLRNNRPISRIILYCYSITKGEELLSHDGHVTAFGLLQFEGRNVADDGVVTLFGALDVSRLVRADDIEVIHAPPPGLNVAPHPLVHFRGGALPAEGFW